MGVLLAQTCSLQLLKGESPTSPLLEVILVGGAAHDWPQLAKGPGGDAGGLLNPVLATPDLPGGLVEPVAVMGRPQPPVRIKKRVSLVATIARHKGLTDKMMGWSC